MFQLLCAVFIGGGTGSVLRWWLGMKLNPVHHAIPIGTLTANLLGAFVIGAGLAWFNRLTGIDPMWKLLITTGFCGGLREGRRSKLAVQKPKQRWRDQRRLLQQERKKLPA